MSPQVKCLLPSATKLRRLYFHTCLSFFPQGGSASVHAGIPHPPDQTLPGAGTPQGAGTPPPRDQTPQEQVSPPRRRLLLRTVRILLEYILVELADRISFLHCVQEKSVFKETWHRRIAISLQCEIPFRGGVKRLTGRLRPPLGDPGWVGGNIDHMSNSFRGGGVILSTCTVILNKWRGYNNA